MNFKIMGTKHFVGAKNHQNHLNSHTIFGAPCIVIAPQAQLLETAKSVGPEALFKQVVKFGQIDPLWSILGDS